MQYQNGKRLEPSWWMTVQSYDTRESREPQSLGPDSLNQLLIILGLPFLGTAAARNYLAQLRVILSGLIFQIMIILLELNWDNLQPYQSSESGQTVLVKLPFGQKLELSVEFQLMMRGYFVQKRKQLRITSSTTTCSQSLDPQKGTKVKSTPGAISTSTSLSTSGPQPAP